MLLDADDYLRLGARRLSVGSHGYAQMFDQKRMQVVHRWVLGLKAGDRMIGDHRNGNRLDNRRSNLRVVNPSGSSQNVAGRGKSRFRGVHPTPYGRWTARVKFRGKNYILGTFATEEAAAKAADTKRRELMPFYVPPEERAA
ncbi:HNH endonuclease [Polymorphospora lycopeni]|uniref:HNH endonuclease n=1 Tax=Polymorphospora lycopeni TaxID=3140240 RepID=UPI0035D3F067